MSPRLHIASFLICFFAPLTTSLNSDGLTLLALKAAIVSDPTGALGSWSDSDSTPCRWAGVVCTHNRVTQLYLPRKALTGYIPSELGLLNSLKRLSLPHNNFSNVIPSNLFNATNLVVLDLSHNSLSGPIPSEIRSLKLLRHLDLSNNFLNGTLPEALADLTGLVGTLNLSHNLFSGDVPESLGRLPMIVSLDLQNNNLTGKIPQVGSLQNQGPTAFSGNAGLCGFPLQNACPKTQKPEISNSTENPQNPITLNPKFLSRGQEEKAKEQGGYITVPIISGVSLIIGAVSFSVWLFRRKLTADDGKLRKQKLDSEVDKDEEEGEEKGKFVVVDEGFNLELEDLLRASAYVVGKSKGGIVYKVVITGKRSCPAATVVAVRRLSEGDGPWRLKEFESEVEAICGVHHPNIVPLRAYYYANDEKLLITDFIRNGSLHAALHGGPSSSLPPLSWAARLKIAQGAARGLKYIHEFGGRKYIHGNLKSTKILLDDDLQPHISGFGFTPLSSGSSKLAPKRQNSKQSIVTSSAFSNLAASSNYYLAPEVRIVGRKYTQKCDVYSFGIVLLELLTGRLPYSGPENDGKILENFVRTAFREETPLSEIIDPAILPEAYAKKQVTAAVHIALNCTERDPELRPRMRTVSESLDRIKLH